MSRPCAVVVGWRAGERAGLAVDRLRADQPGCAVVFVDNEADGATPRSEIVALTDNRGYAGGANAGLERAFADPATSHALLLNDDIELAPGALRLLAEACGDGACASPVIEADGPDAFDGGLIDARGFGRHEPGARDFLTGAALCMPRVAWERVGPLDERLFLYYEDVEWCLRARAEGFALRVEQGATAQHEGGRSTGGGQGETWAYYSTRNRLWLLQRMRGRATARREAANTSARAVWRVREPVGRAKLLGVRDWAEGRMGRGPFPR
jgi:N-acetylglucosaminyl-diphospho-decaprenol L-rhamnosyltransferase